MQQKPCFRAHNCVFYGNTFEETKIYIYVSLERNDMFRLRETCSDGIQGVRTGSREPVLGISARLANPFLEFQHV